MAGVHEMYYLTIKMGLAGLNHSAKPFAPAMEIIAVFPEPPAPYNTKGLLQGPVIYFFKISSSFTRP